MNSDESIFYLSVATLVAGCVSLIIRYSFRSKCDRVKCCGCCEIHRDTNVELTEDMFGVNKNTSRDDRVGSV